MQANIEAIDGAVHGQDGDGAALVVEAPAGGARGRVPAGDGLRAANVREARDLALRLPVVAGDEPVVAVGAGNVLERAAAVVVASVIGNCRRAVLVVSVASCVVVLYICTSSSHGSADKSRETEKS